MIPHAHPATSDTAITFSQWLSKRPNAGPRAAEVGRAVWRAAAVGHTCLPLNQLCDEHPEALAGTAAEWGSVVGLPGSAAPIILDAQHLYLARLHRAELSLAGALRARLMLPPSVPRPETLTLLRELFAQSQLGAVAGLVTIQRRLSVIMGGPGTGKTWTVLRLLALLHAEHPGLRVAVAAPTGKAAQRMRESMARDLGDLPASVSANARAAIAAAASAAGTLHRLLGFRPDHGVFTHHAQAPLSADAVVIDEASMVDLPLFTALLAALRPATSLILLGDPCQLASVETGVVLGDLQAARGGGYGPILCASSKTELGITLPAAQTPSMVSEVVVELLESHRFSRDSGIGKIAHHLRRAIARHAGAPEAAWSALSSEKNVSASQVAYVTDDLTEALTPALVAFKAVLQQADPTQALAALDKARVLSPRHGGPTGVEALITRIERALGVHGLMYPGRPILISVNDASTGLSNGDVGILWPDSDDTLCAWFPHLPPPPVVSHSDSSTDTKSTESLSSVRSVPVSQLPAHVTAWAMTVHKSQGSEFSTVVVILPQHDGPSVGHRLVSSELLYTAVTRAKSTLVVCASKSTFIQAARTQAQRCSLLASRIKENVVL